MEVEGEGDESEGRSGDLDVYFRGFNKEIDNNCETC